MSTQFIDIDYLTVENYEYGTGLFYSTPALDDENILTTNDDIVLFLLWDCEHGQSSVVGHITRNPMNDPIAAIALQAIYKRKEYTLVLRDGETEGRVHDGANTRDDIYNKTLSEIFEIPVGQIVRDTDEE